MAINHETLKRVLNAINDYGIRLSLGNDFCKDLDECVKALEEPVDNRRKFHPGVWLTRDGIPCDYGCNSSIGSTPVEMLQFLAGRFEHAGVGEGVAMSYAADIRRLLASMNNKG